tara:strand:- start:117 stop:767 length:651 start_codon:yes stop_codon:yes gene_type:complete
MNKRGITTIFITLALIILILVFLSIFQFDSFTNAFAADTTETWETFEDVQNFEETLQDCLEEQTEETIQLLALQGGYINPTNYTKLNSNKISYISELTLSIIEQELETELEDSLERDCFFGQDQDLNSVSIDINQETIEISTDWDLEILEQKAQAPHTELESNLYEIYNIAQDIYQSEQITSLTYENTTIEVTTLNSDYVYTITQQDLVFMFVKQF